VLAEVAAQQHPPHGTVGFRHAFDLWPRAIAGAIVDQDDLVANVHLGEHRGEALVQVGHARSAAIHGDHHAEVGPPIRAIKIHPADASNDVRRGKAL
jgi:hypothetical protein